MHVRFSELVPPEESSADVEERERERERGQMCGGGGGDGGREVRSL